jgi:hypothetical protein
MSTVALTRRTPRAESASPTVLILCSDEGIRGELIRDLASRRYQPLVGRPNWSWRAALEWARPVAAVVDTSHPAAHSDALLAASGDLEVGLVVFDGSPDSPPGNDSSGARGGGAVVRTTDVEVIGGAVDAAVRRRAARGD